MVYRPYRERGQQGIAVFEGQGVEIDVMTAARA
jgi:hypothetical protein